jgi:hypothetical protein
MTKRKTSHPIERASDDPKATGVELPVRIVISWFGHSIRNMELLEDEDWRRWARALKAMCKESGFVIERLGSMIDIIVGIPGKNVTPHDFFRFQRAFDALNDRLECEMGGVLWLMDIHRQSGEDALVDAPREVYVNGRVSLGDSIGRPQRHYLPAIRNRKRRSVETSPASDAPKS